MSDVPQSAVDPWLGPLPADWTTKRLGALGELIKGRGGSKEDNRDTGVPVVRYGDLYTKFDTIIAEPAAYVSEEDAANYTPLPKHSLVFAASGESAEDIGKSALSLLDEPVVVGGDAVIFRPDDKIDPLYLAYTLESTPMRSYKAIRSTGFTVVHISAGKLKTLPIPCPPRPAQRAIADYLDRETARIDTLIEEQQRLVVLLAERRVAVIAEPFSRAHPTVPLGSALEELIDHRGKTPGKVGNKTDDFTDEGVPVVSAIHIKDGKISWGERERFVPYWMFEKWMPVRLRAGDVLLTSEAPLGNVAQVPSDAPLVLSQRLFALRSREDILDATYLRFFLESDRGQALLRDGASGSTVSGIRQSRLVQVPVPIPPLDEQREVSKKISEQIVKIDSLVDETERFIELARERRAALITAAVTGQVDVREMV